MGNKFAYFSNTPEEFEVFAKTGILFWPRGLHLMVGKTKYQRERNIQIVEQIGDTIFVVAGSKIRGFEYEVNDRKIRIDKVPSIVYVGTVTEVFHYPIICYRFTPELNRKVVANLPLQVFPLLKNFKSFLGRPLTDKDKSEIENVIKLQEVIQQLLQNKQISFKRVDSTKNVKYKKWLVDEYSKDKILDFLATKIDPKVHWHDYVAKLDTWRGSEFVKVQIENKNPLMLELSNSSLDQGISTRLLLDEELEYYDRLLPHEAQDYSQIIIAVLRKVRQLERERGFFRNGLNI